MAKRTQHPLKQWLKERGIRRPEMAKRIGVSTSVISGVINGYLVVSLEVAIKLSLATGLPVEAFAQRPASKTLKLYVERQNALDDSLKENVNVA